jgi:hypothetical protein
MGYIIIIGVFHIIIKEKIMGQSLGDTFWVAEKKKLIIDVAEVTGK